MALSPRAESARRVRHLLTALDVTVIAYDPCLSLDEAEILGIELVPLARLPPRGCRLAAHPDLPETQGLITGDLLSSMKANASCINTARSAIVRHDELIGVLARQRDLWAAPDVTEVATDEEFRRLQELPQCHPHPAHRGLDGTRMRPDGLIHGGRVDALP